MKGFGNNNRAKSSKRTIKNIENSDGETLIKKALSIHREGNLKEAAKYYLALIENGFANTITLNNLGVIYQQFNQVNKAIALYKSAIEKFPDNPLAYSNLGKIFLDKKDYSKAKFYLQKAIKLNPNFIRAYKNLINILVIEGNLTDAEYLLRKSIKLDPSEADSYLNLGCVLKERGKINDAEIFLKKALDLKPNFLNAYINLGSVFNELGKKAEAEKALKKALEIDPKSALAFNNYGNLLSSENRFEEALDKYKKAIQINPNFALANNNLGSILMTLGRVEKSIKFTERAIQINPNFELAIVNLGIAKIELNDIDGAEICFLDAIKIKKDYQFAISNLFRLYEKSNDLEKLKSSLKKYRNNTTLKNEVNMYMARVNFREKKFLEAKTLIDSVSRDWIEQTDTSNKILFYSFKAFIEDKNQNYDEAFRCFSKSQLNPKYDLFDAEAFKKYIKDYGECKILNRSQNKLRKSNFVSNTVFLLGFPRSGTTLLDTILRSHPDIDVLEEKPILNTLEEIIKSDFKCNLNEIYNLEENEVNSLRKKYLKDLKFNADKEKNAKIIINKFPFQTVSLPLIILLFPDAKIIFTHRNPYDTVLSCFQQAFEPNNAMANFKTIKSASYIYDLTMKMWDKYKKELEMNFFMSKYENLVENFDDQISKILNFLELEWDKNLKNYRNTALKRRKINTPSSSQVVQPIYKSSMEKWKNYEKYFEDSHEYLQKWLLYFKY